jgi:putative polyketide hydroxylase
MQNTNRIAREVFDINSSASKNDWEKVRALIAQSRLRGTGLGQDLGITYARGALLPDGSAAPVVDDPINDYEPSARPGSRAPHLWIERQGVKLSTLDVVGGKFVLLAGPDYNPVTQETDSVTVLRNERDFVADGFEELYGISSNGAVLVRPDGYVGARWVQLPKNFRGQFRSALTSILGI